jgi:hypothetical protein
MSEAATFQDPMFQDEDKAREALEAVRWPNGPICPHRGNSDQEMLAKVAGATRIAPDCTTATSAKASSA